MIPSPYFGDFCLFMSVDQYAAPSLSRRAYSLLLVETTKIVPSAIINGWAVATSVHHFFAPVPAFILQNASPKPAAYTKESLATIGATMSKTDAPPIMLLAR